LSRRGCSGHGGIGGEGSELDTAHTWTISGDLHFDVTSVTPRGAPRVTDEVVWGTCRISSVSDSGNGVVEAGTASASIVQDTTAVVLEDGRGGIDSNGDDILGDGGLEGRLTLLSDGTVGGNIHQATVGKGGITSWDVSSARDVWIVGIGGLVVRLQVVEHVWLISTVATLVSE